MPRVRIAVLGALLRLPRLFIRAGDVVFRVGYVLFASLRGSLGVPGDAPVHARGGVPERPDCP